MISAWTLPAKQKLLSQQQATGGLFAGTDSVCVVKPYTAGPAPNNGMALGQFTVDAGATLSLGANTINFNGATAGFNPGGEPLLSPTTEYSDTVTTQSSSISYLGYLVLSADTFGLIYAEQFDTPVPCTMVGQLLRFVPAVTLGLEVGGSVEI